MAAAKKAPAKKVRIKGRDYGKAAATLKMAADATRLQILLMLDREGMNVGSMCEALGIMTQPAVSHHLALLRAARLVEPARHGKTIVYSLTESGRELMHTVASVTDLRP
jgi:DNA-binding transcriptional ArsR family regulator